MSIPREFRAMIVDQLRKDAALNAFVSGRIYDDEPTDVQYPFVTIDGVTVVPWEAECIKGQDRTIQISAWSNVENTLECEELVDAIQNAIHGADMEMPNYQLVNIKMLLARVIDDPNPSVKHGVLQFEADIASG